MRDHVLFWKNGAFSNFHPCVFELDGHLFPSSEHAFMHSKAMFCGDTNSAEKILQATTPMAAKQLGRKVSGFEEQLWEQHREEIMERVLFAKFDQNHKLRERILALPMDCVFVEASPYDRVWGVGRSARELKEGVKWQGMNLLGVCLDRVKSHLHELHPVF